MKQASHAAGGARRGRSCSRTAQPLFQTGERSGAPADRPEQPKPFGRPCSSRHRTRRAIRSASDSRSLSRLRNPGSRSHVAIHAKRVSRRPWTAAATQPCLPKTRGGSLAHASTRRALHFECVSLEAASDGSSAASDRESLRLLPGVDSGGRTLPGGRRRSPLRCRQTRPCRLLNIISIPRTMKLACPQTPPAVSPRPDASPCSCSPIGTGYNLSRSRNRRGTSFASRTSITSQPARRALSIPGPESSSAMASSTPRRRMAV